MWHCLWVSGYVDINQDLLQLNNHLYEEAQEMDLAPLTLPTFFDNIVEKYAFEHV